MAFTKDTYWKYVRFEADENGDIIGMTITRAHKVEEDGVFLAEQKETVSDLTQTEIETIIDALKLKVAAFVTARDAQE